MLIDERLRQFKPKLDLAILNSDDPEFRACIRTWALARLLAWVTLDQRAGKRPPNSDTWAVHKLRTKNARLVGHLALVHLLDQQAWRDDQNKEDLKAVLRIFKICGGFGVFLQSVGAKGLLSRAKRAKKDLGYVYQIVTFLCRYEAQHGNDNRFNLDHAKYFVEKNMHEDDATFKKSKINKLWDKYKQASPYIFAFYRPLLSRLPKAKTANQVFELLDHAASNHRRLKRLLGHAAYAAGTLSRTKARNLRLKDLSWIAPAKPPLRHFDSEESSLIDSYDPNASEK